MSIRRLFWTVWEEQEIGACLQIAFFAGLVGFMLGHGL